MSVVKRNRKQQKERLVASVPDSDYYKNESEKT